MDTRALLAALSQGIQATETWQSDYPAYEIDDTLKVPETRLREVLAELSCRLKDNYPFFHPVYAGQMLKPPHPAAVAAYVTAMLVNPNNHALDGGPATAEMEKECVAELARFFGYDKFLGHLTSSGTIANLEALWVARELHPDRPIVHSSQAHYTHSRMSQVLRLRAIEVASTPRGGMDVGALRRVLEKEPVGTVVASLGTTSLGAFDPLEEILTLKEKFRFRIHVDAAYGGFYRVLAGVDPSFKVFELISRCDSLVVDPHKHGLQPYGCGCVLFRDPSVGRFYSHDSPYTYFTSRELHLGEISLECSRAGAAAAALWLTLRLFPLSAQEGFGPILKKTRQAALRFAALLAESPHFALYLEPELDIVTYLPRATSLSRISAETERIFQAAMASKTHPVFTAKLRVSADCFARLHPLIERDSDSVTLFRSCLMRPEQLEWTPKLLAHLESHAQK